MKIKILVFSLILIPAILFSQEINKPKLVVGIVVDQMRSDYLEKYSEDFGEDGFKRLIKNGTNFTNCIINYIPTVTAAGHASIYTGTTPYYHGIISNDWKDRINNREINACTAISPANKMFVEGISKDLSPEQLMSTTIGDQLKLDNYGKSKVISISLKDRGAMLPAGKSADGAFWFDNSSGNFVSSFYYMKNLPKWVSDFNKSGKVNSYLEKKWNLLKPIETYLDLPDDNSVYENDLFNEGRTSFPHSLDNVPDNEKYDKFAHTPWGNQILVDLAKEALLGENLGKGKFIDHLAISFSTPDKIGHAYGPQSYEVMDNYLRLDQQIADLLSTLDLHVGKGNYILFLTADHGAQENTQHLLDMNIDAGVLENTNFYNDLLTFLEKKYNSTKIIKTRFSRNLYLDFEVLDSLNLNRNDVEQIIKEYLLFNVPEIAEAYTRTELELLTASRNNNNFILNGFNKKRSGDILYSLKANYLNWEHKFGSQHGSGHEYDNHIPLIFYGNNIPSETNSDKVFIVDIAATVCDYIGINKPSDCIGIPLLNK
ncbi:MAG: alkaline phosphatase family protein [Melioribacteraceae bacterium]|nr:alkaline phosphatase family protein [Melioribacteraceae bacterium]